VILLFLSMCALALVIGILFVPETRGRSLEAIEEDVLSGKRIRRVGAE